MMPPDPEQIRRSQELQAEIREDTKVTTYFETLGYEVTWDYNRRAGEEWHEICDKDGTVAQIDTGVPLADIVEDLTRMAAGKKGTSKSDYQINAEEGPRFKKLCRAVAKNQMGGIQEDLPL